MRTTLGAGLLISSLTIEDICEPVPTITFGKTSQLALHYINSEGRKQKIMLLVTLSIQIIFVTQKIKF